MVVSNARAQGREGATYLGLEIVVQLATQPEVAVAPLQIIQRANIIPALGPQSCEPPPGRLLRFIYRNKTIDVSFIAHGNANH